MKARVWSPLSLYSTDWACTNLHKYKLRHQTPDPYSQADQTVQTVLTLQILLTLHSRQCNADTTDILDNADTADIADTADTITHHSASSGLGEQTFPYWRVLIFISN